MNATVGGASATVMVTLCSPWMACGAPTPPPVKGARVSDATPTSSIHRPDGSTTSSDRSSKRASPSMGERPCAASRARHHSSDAAGTANDVVVTCPAPFTPTGTPRPL